MCIKFYVNYTSINKQTKNKRKNPSVYKILISFSCSPIICLLGDYKQEDENVLNVFNSTEFEH